MSAREPSNVSTRLNLSVPVDIAIQIEKESENLGLSRTQYVKQAIVEKLNQSSTSISNDGDDWKEELSIIKHLSVSILEKITRDKKI